MLLLLLLPVASGVVVSNLKMTSTDGTMDEPWVADMFTRMVHDELIKEFGEAKPQKLPEGVLEEHLDVSFETDPDDVTADNVKVVLVRTYTNGTVKREDINVGEDRGSGARP